VDRSDKRQQTVRRAVSGRVTSIVKLLSHDSLIAGLTELKLSPDYAAEDYDNYITKQHKRVWQALSTLGYTEEAEKDSCSLNLECVLRAFIWRIFSRI
jgi:hypothetical protein